MVKPGLLIMEKKKQRKVVADFIKAFSCTYSITKNLSTLLDIPVDPFLLKSVVGFSSGISTMGDTCGVVNGGVTVLGKKYPELPALQFYLLCAEYFKRLEDRLDTPDCGRVHGGKHLANNFRRAILSGKILKCVEILAHGADILETLAKQADQDDFSFADAQRKQNIDAMATYFEEEEFHCCKSTVFEIANMFNISAEPVLHPSRGFVGGIGFNGTVCGAVSGGVLCLGLLSHVNLEKSGYSDTLKITLHGLLKSEKIFTDEKRFVPAKLFKECKHIYQTVENRFGSAHCCDILGLSVDTKEGCRQYREGEKIALCREVVQTVVDTVKTVCEKED